MKSLRSLNEDNMLYALKALPSRSDEILAPENNCNGIIYKEKSGILFEME